MKNIINKVYKYRLTKINNLKQKTMNLEKYKKNLRIEGNKVISYVTHVATIDGDKLRQLGYWSVTTQKHINYVARELNLNLIK
tara:strand:- start:167 stop:415 length:249 start_codon:yes stop_codon:yes gene_type:complete